MARTLRSAMKTNKKYGNKLSKQGIAEQFFIEGKKDNTEIANSMTLLTGPTTADYVKTMKSRWKQKIKNQLQENRAYQRLITGEVNKQDIKEVFSQAIYRVAADMATGDLNEDNRTKAFTSIIQKVGG